ncbi:flagellar biosynthesis regulator FlaF [Sphingobium subterraneum]|uniref:Flagellar protein FlaF n=1 Tax=Sphingobium subterraneum TaxID=627688 RepID=A0A841J453_9SPHN|nr:flagellar biosynthesis regulator FlaF [Sphingobium subterraneum]MBB6124296.1 flagellar protein FlaF [Sphingobium subterraneum]
MSVSAYKRAQVATEHPRDTEHRLLSQVTGAMIDAQQRGEQGRALADILHWNREIWQTFGAICGDSANRLPPPLRAGIISLSLWVDRHSSEVIAEREGIEDLIAVNRMIMEGLAGHS